MHENTPLLNHDEHQQTEALDFMAWQQQMETPQVPVQTSPDVQINQPEVARPASIIEQFGDEVVTVFGHTGTLKDLMQKRGRLCPEEPDFHKDEIFGAKVLEKKGVDITEKFAHLSNAIQKQKTEAGVVDKHKEAKIKVEPARVTPQSAVSEQSITASKQITEATTAKLLGLETESTTTNQDEVETESSEQAKTVDEAPVTAGGGPDLNELAKEMTDSLDTPRLPNVAILRKRLLDLDPSTFKSTKAAAANLAERSEVEVMPPTDFAAQSEVPQATEANYEEQMVQLYLEAASEVASNTDNYATIEGVSDEMIANFLGTDHLDGAEPPEGNYALPGIPIATTLNTLSNISNIENLGEIPTEQPLVLSALPAELTTDYQKAIEELEPEAVEQLISMVETMSLIAERLQILESTQQSEGNEAQQIITVLEAYYDQFLQALHGADAIDVEARRVFIAEVRKNTFRKTIAQAFNIPLEGTREFDRDMIKQALMSQGRQQPSERKKINLARIFAILGIGQDLQDA
jgi:hypothetical protein